MCPQIQCTADPSSVRRARQFVVDQLQEWRRDDLVDGAALMTSELATNAVVHTGQPYAVSVERRDRGVRVEVADRVHALPPSPNDVRVARTSTSEVVDVATLFSGLGVVDAIATRWGSDAIPGAGKVVWFELNGATTPAGGRGEMSDLSDLRSPPPPDGLDGTSLGKGTGHAHRAEEAETMSRHDDIVDEDRRIDEREIYTVERRGGPMRWVLALILVAAVAVGIFLLMGGSADVDTEGKLEVPEVDVDVNAPDVDVTTEPAPPASAEAG